ncbi:MAG: hypothetical protein KKB21_04975 [Nanoarchaeota archaeon]|nr:hypothetical protein [Nanoarchaeota archaeon]MBU4086899.1 hypothetical protein [Nanoarchaeota archaeon]
MVYEFFEQARQHFIEFDKYYAIGAAAISYIFGAWVCCSLSADLRNMWKEEIKLDIRRGKKKSLISKIKDS